ncbi:hypothetical protein ABNQ39_00095 (plasmid) [Azospirillum sp. A26]|uniref:hypothetical protein n=1 Tax=Azospirillum sp. A26 TaxID=3160607 RepID=UPI00366A7E02
MAACRHCGLGAGRHFDGCPGAPVETVAVTPDRLAWLKRPEVGERVWELPNGTLYTFAPGAPQMVTVLKESLP